MRSLLIALGAATLVACGGSSTDGQPASGGAGGVGGSGGSGGEGAAACGVPDLACPAAKPYPGATCQVSSSCEYPVGDQMNTWTYTCESGRWQAVASCNAPPGGGCPIPPLAEKCDTPFTGSASGAAIEIGIADPSQPFRSFQDGEEINMLWGGQGSPMVPYRVRVSGVDASCIRIDTTLTLAAKSAAPTPNAIVLRCGESLSIYDIVPVDLLDCQVNEQLVDLDILVEVQGVGSATAHVTLQNPGCALSG